MTGLDCNILIALAFADHPANPKTVAAVRAETERPAKLVFPPLIVTEFLHVATDERRFSPPLSMSEAVDWVEGFLANPSVSLVQPTHESTHQTLRWMAQYQLGRKRILDTHLAAVLHTSGERRLLTANPSDFAVFGVLETVVP
jgi:predicted nucleic acid-binding protein